jgi:hypothetical protein
MLTSTGPRKLRHVQCKAQTPITIAVDGPGKANSKYHDANLHDSPSERLKRYLQDLRYLLVLVRSCLWKRDAEQEAGQALRLGTPWYRWDTLHTHTHTHAHTLHTRTHTRMHARTHTHTRTHTLARPTERKKYLAGEQIHLAIEPTWACLFDAL